MRKMNKLSPRRAATFNQVCKLKEDNIEKGNYSIFVDEENVTITEAAKPGSSILKSIDIPKKYFNKIVDWYNRSKSIQP